MEAIHLAFRSSFSLLRGCRSPEEICRFAVERSLSTIAIADINNFYGLIRFLLAARRNGIKPLAAVTVERQGRQLLTAYVMGRRGFSRICGIITNVLTDSQGSFDPVSDLVEHGWEGLSVL